MAVQVQNGGVWKTISACKVFRSGAWRDAVALRIFSSGSWRLVTFATSGTAMTVSISPSSFAVSGPRATQTVTLAATPSAGVSPYTYAWTITADSDSSPGFDDATLATVTLNSDRRLGSGNTESLTVRCTATDSLGNTAHADVSGTFHQT